MPRSRWRSHAADRCTRSGCASRSTSCGSTRAARSSASISGCAPWRVRSCRAALGGDCGRCWSRAVGQRDRGDPAHDHHRAGHARRGHALVGEQRRRGGRHHHAGLAQRRDRRGLGDLQRGERDRVGAEHREPRHRRSRRGRGAQRAAPACRQHGDDVDRRGDREHGFEVAERCRVLDALVVDQRVARDAGRDPERERQAAGRRSTADAAHQQHAAGDGEDARPPRRRRRRRRARPPRRRARSPAPRRGRSDTRT